MIAPGADRPDGMEGSPRQLRRPSRRLMWLFALAVLLPSLYGFGTKFLEFVALFRGDVDGAFAITPILNYLLASMGFLLLFAWAATHGMFRNVEAPKYAMLENEAWLDRLESRGRPPGSVPFPAAVAPPPAAHVNLRLRGRDDNE